MGISESMLQQITDLNQVVSISCVWRAGPRFNEALGDDLVIAPYAYGVSV